MTRSIMTALVLLLCIATNQAAAQGQATPPGEGEVRVGNLVYGDGKSGVCFSEGFLDTVARRSDVRLMRTFSKVELASDAFFDHPFVVMSGESAFTLSEQEKRNLKTYVERGGFILASAGCSSAPWSQSFREVAAELFGEDSMQPLAMDHPLFHTLFEIEKIELTKSKRVDDPHPIYGIELDGALRVVFSPLGLNDTAEAGEGCCCCGGNEVRNAKLINANVLLYALTH